MKLLNLAAGTLTFFALLSPLGSAATAYPLDPTSEPVRQAVAYFSSIQLPDGNIGYSYMVSAWVTMGLASVGVDPHTVRVGATFNSVVDYLLVHDARLRSANTLPTDWERVILALAAAGENPRTFAGTDHVASLLAYWDGVQFGSPNALNDDFFAVLALRAAGYPTTSPYVQGSLNFIVAHQNPDGGWSYAVGAPSDSDDTGAALMALDAAGYQASSSSASTPTCLNDAIACAVAYLDWLQNPDGGFPQHAIENVTSVSNTASDAWAIQGLVAVGQDPTSANWTTESGATPVSNLLSLQQSDGSFAWTGTSISGPAWMTAYALPALVGKPYPVSA